MDFIQCCDSKDKIVQDFKMVPGWKDNPEILKIAEKIQENLKNTERGEIKEKCAQLCKNIQQMEPDTEMCWEPSE